MSSEPVERGGAVRPRKSYSRQEAWRDVLLGGLIVTAVIAAYFIGRHRRVGHLNAFAQCLSARQIKIYGAYWCPHCADQKEVFGSAFQYVAYVECGIKGSRAEAPECLQAGVKRFPTWQFADGERKEGTMQLKDLSAESGCSLP
jgi:phage baseplate assembly protein gpV